MDEILRHYDTLGVSTSASILEIKKAFRKRALKCHPDLNDSDDAAKEFKKLKNAYDELLRMKEEGDYVRYAESRAKEYNTNKTNKPINNSEDSFFDKLYKHWQKKYEKDKTQKAKKRAEHSFREYAEFKKNYYKKHKKEKNKDNESIQDVLVEFIQSDFFIVCSYIGWFLLLWVCYKCFY